MKKILQKYHFLLPVFTLLIVFFLTDYYENINKGPQSTHFWRQSDCYSLTLNYYQNGMHFFKPEIHNLHADENQSGQAISECPILYYTVASLYHVFGPHYSVYRIVWILLFFGGIIFLHLTLFRLSKNIAFSYLLSSNFAISPLLIFYSSAFIPDIPALMFVLAAWYYLVRHIQRETESEKYLRISFILFLLAALTKSTALISFLALGGIFILEIIAVKFNTYHKKIFPNRWRSLLYFTIVLVVFSSWYFFALKYNEIHKSIYFSMRTWSILDYSEISNMSKGEVFKTVKSNWIPHIFSNYFQYFLLIALLGIIVFIKRINKLLIIVLLFSIIGIIAYFLLWFGAFIDHDYYFIVTLIVPALILMSSADLFSKIRLKPLIKYSIFGILGFTLILSVLHTIRKQNHRKHGFWNRETELFNDMEEIKVYFPELEIHENDLIISIPDRTPNYTLSSLNQKGWTDFNNLAYDTETLKKYIQYGAKYLFIFDYEYTLSQHPYLKDFITTEVAAYNDVRIFRIDGEKAKKTLIQELDTLAFLTFPLQIATWEANKNKYYLYTEQINNNNNEQIRNDSLNSKNVCTYQEKIFYTKFFNLKNNDMLSFKGEIDECPGNIHMVFTNSNSNKFTLSIPFENKDIDNKLIISKTLVFQESWDIDTLIFFIHNPNEGLVNLKDFSCSISKRAKTYIR